ncbi:MAG: beta galactosidase jelly roll domain-containing protein, partial [Chitinispirillaceae bacterium]|nr:beta galactosidase jelly roll domain-containing protein [Chitinispirillaceae bacterium]
MAAAEKKNHCRLYFVAVLSLLGLFHASAGGTQPSTQRTWLDISSNEWKFMGSNSLIGAEATGFADASWSSVRVPHTWNTKEVRTTYTNAWYRTRFAGSPRDTANGRRMYCHFGAINANAEVFLNGVRLGDHKGGYTAFVFDATHARRDGDNVLAIRVDNQNHLGLPANGNGWLHYGGVIRSVKILYTGACGIDPMDHASSGVYIRQERVSSEQAVLSIKTMIRNSSSGAKSLTVRHCAYDSSGVLLSTIEKAIAVPAGSRDSTDATGSISGPVLWNIGAPYLYRIVTLVLDGDIVIDAVEGRTGFRYYSLTTSTFSMNGTPKPLRGACLHAENEYQGAAIDTLSIQRQFHEAQELGMNFIRLVHYPHSSFALDCADRLGIAVMVETGLYQNSTYLVNEDRDNNAREMVKQGFNHPSVIFWCAGNEDYNNSNVYRLATVIRATDSTRPVTYASSGQNPLGCDYIFHNIYQGWYSGAIQDFPAGKNWISESGAGGVVTSHQDYRLLSWTVNQWEPEEYQALVNEYKFEHLFTANPIMVPFYTHWLLYDMADFKYKGINTKGMFTCGGMPKDCAYLWKAKARPALPLVAVCGKCWYVRSGVRSVKVYANRPSITLIVNGASRGTLLNGAYRHPSGGAVIHDVFLFENALDRGKNVVVATDGATASDTAVMYFTGTAPDAPADTSALITELESSNANNPAFFVNMPVKSNWPVYYQCDGNADNTFDTLPRILSGARWIATKRQSAAPTTLSFKTNPGLAKNAEVFVMCTRQSTAPAWLVSGGFSNTGVAGKWVDNSLNLVDYQLYGKTVAPGEKVSSGSSAIDFV